MALAAEDAAVAADAAADVGCSSAKLKSHIIQVHQRMRFVAAAARHAMIHI